MGRKTACLSVKTQKCSETSRPLPLLLFKLLNFFSFFLIEGVWVGVGGWAGLRLLMKFSPASPSSSSASLLFLISCLMGSHVIMFQSSWEHPPTPNPAQAEWLNDAASEAVKRWRRTHEPGLAGASSGASLPFSLVQTKLILSVFRWTCSLYNFVELFSF